MRQASSQDSSAESASIQAGNFRVSEREVIKRIFKTRDKV
jgi:hypothetical protein